MIQYNALKVKLSISQRNKLKSGIKNDTEIFWKFHRMLMAILMMKMIFCISYY